MDWSLILNWAFVVALLTAAIRLAVPVLLAALGEIVTERAGVLNLGLEGVMAMGGVAGFMVAYFAQSGPWPAPARGWAWWPARLPAW